jgi:hypothetical protein
MRSQLISIALFPISPHPIKMSQSLLNLVAIAVFLMTFSALLAPILPISPFIPVATTFGLLGLVTVDQWSWGGTGTKIIADIFATAEDRDRVAALRDRF